jgi:hypothetical protein
MHCKCQNLRGAGTTGLAEVPLTLNQTFSATHFVWLWAKSGYIYHTQYSFDRWKLFKYPKVQNHTDKSLHACLCTAHHIKCMNIIGSPQCFAFGCMMLAKSSFLFTHSEWAKFWTSTKYSVANYFQRPCVTLHNFVSLCHFKFNFIFSVLFHFY